VGGHSQDTGPKMRWSSSLALYFESILHSWALPIVKHEVKVIMNLNICKSGGIRGVGFSCIVLTKGRDPVPTYRCGICPTLKENPCYRSFLEKEDGYSGI